MARGESLGVLELFAPVARRLSARERGMAQATANQLAAAVQNTRVFAAQRHIADTLQRALLTVPDKIQGIDLGHFYRSASIKAGEVGGDFYSSSWNTAGSRSRWVTCLEKGWRRPH